MDGYFRNEIAGLRALAVLAVVLFHLKVPGFRGGFIGVDVFFVISGYLISRNILRDLDRDRFSFSQFYTRRARRIFPALIFTVVLTYLLGALWCSPLMFLDLAKECTHALLSIANIQYWRESHQYFAAASDELALLHTWSLSAEEQFYLFWPIFLVLAKRTGRPFTAIALAALISLVGAIAVANSDPTAAFFLTPFRIFEFATGAMLLALREGPAGPTAETLSGAGVVAIVASALLFHSEMPYQSAAVLLPCLGAAAVIWAGDKTAVARLIANRPMMWIGAISYSLYLCHWPIIFFGRFIFGAAADTWPGVVAMAVTMLIVADLMYRFVERRYMVRAQAEASFWKTAIGLWPVVLVLVAVTHGTFISQGFAWRLPQSRAEQMRLQSFPSSADIKPLAGPVGVQIVGDSLAIQYAYGLQHLMRQLNISFEPLGNAGCPVLDGVTLSKHGRRALCIEARNHAMDRLAKSQFPVLFAQRWEFYDDSQIDYALESDIPPVNGAYKKLRKALERELATMVAQGHRVLIVGPQVKLDCRINVPRLMPGPLPHAPLPPCPPISKAAAQATLAPLYELLADAASRWPDKVELLRTLDIFCDDECPTVVNGIWQFNNPSHYSIAGSERMIGRSEGLFREFLQNEAAKP
jgi:peptidoglycan/LPS O-acetylase OafA/YrhL